MAVSSKALCVFPLLCAFASPLAAQGLEQGSVSAFASTTDVDGLDDNLDTNGVSGMLDFSLSPQIGLTLNGSYSSGELFGLSSDLAAVDGTVYYRSSAGFKFGATLGTLEFTEVAFEGETLDPDLGGLTYGLAAMFEEGPIAIEGQYQILDLEELDDNWSIFSLGGEYALNPDWELTGSVASLRTEVGDFDETINDIGVGIEYNLGGFQMHGGVSKTSADDYDATTFSAGFSLLFGNEDTTTTRERTFSGIGLN